MRLFLAILLPEETLTRLEQGVRQLRREGVRASWCRRETYHLTLEFLGEAPDPAPVRAAMERVTARPFSLRFTDCGRFRGRGGDVFWLGVEPSEPLLSLREHLRRELSEAGFTPERRPYRPHLTLARRLRHREPLGFPGPVPEPVAVGSFSLMRSELRREGAQYTELFRRELREWVGDS